MDWDIFLRVLKNQVIFIIIRMIRNGPGLLLCTKDPPYQIWEVFYRGEVLMGKRMRDVANEIFSKEVKIPEETIKRLTDDSGTMCLAMNELITS